MHDDQIIAGINALSADLPVVHEFTAWRIALAAHLNSLINTDFQKLVFLMYRIDISEPKLKILLAEHPDENAGLLIADMMIERQRQKIATREAFKNSQAGGEEERW